MIAPCLGCGRAVRGPATQDPWLCDECRGKPSAPRPVPDVVALPVALVVSTLAGAVVIGAAVANAILRRLMP